jgi:very-short-patch-repair endonuclease
MNGDLRQLLSKGSGVVTRAEALTVVPAHTVDYALRAGLLVRLHHAVYADPHGLDRRTRLRAAVRYGRDSAALSHLSALEMLGLREGAVDEPVHLTTAPATAFTGAGLVVHRVRGFAMSPPGVLVRQGLPVTNLEQSVVDSWPFLPPEDRRAPAIRAVTDRRTTPGRLRAVLDTRPHLADRATLARVLHLLEIGCHSPLEIWGHDHVFTGPGMPEFQRQVPVTIGGRTVYLDLYAEEEMVNFELDGRDGHSSAADRERDLRRDSALAARGILVVRFTGGRLVHDVAAVRRESLAIIDSRRGIRVNGAGKFAIFGP